MTSRQRVLTAVAHREPDRVPVNFGGESCTSIVESIPEGRIYTRLCQKLGLFDISPVLLNEYLNIVLNVDERVMDRFGSDFRMVFPGLPQATVEADGTKTWDRFCGIRIKRVGLYDEFFDFPLREKTSIADIRKYPFWPDTADPLITDGKREQARNLHEKTDFAVVGVPLFSALPFNFYSFMVGMDRWLSDPILNPRFYFALCDKLLELGMTMMERWLREVGEFLDIVAVFDDLGSQEGLLISPQHYRTFIHPYTKQIIENIRRAAPGVKIWRHSCGSCYEVLRDFVEIGIDIVHPVQPRARHMEPWRLKKEFGRDITFATGIDIQHTLPRLTPGEVGEEVRSMIQTYGPGGGFILCATHNLEPDCPPENIVAAFDAAQRYGGYPLQV